MNLIPNESLMNTILSRSPSELERFAAICSHDLKEPLRVISNFAQLLLIQNAGTFDETSQTYVHYILQNINRMETLIHHLLLYAHVSETNVGFTAVNLETVLKTLHNDVRFRLEDVEGILHMDRLPTVQANPIQMVQLFTNLIDNAIKFRGKEPLVIELITRSLANHWAITVRDNGIGIDAQCHEKIFAMFTRLNSKRDYDGSGIGLAICKKIAESHDGRLDVSSNPKGGCDFCLILPKR